MKFPGAALAHFRARYRRLPCPISSNVSEPRFKHSLRYRFSIQKENRYFAFTVRRDESNPSMVLAVDTNVDALSSFIACISVMYLSSNTFSCCLSVYSRLRIEDCRQPKAWAISFQYVSGWSSICLMCFWGIIFLLT